MANRMVPERAACKSFAPASPGCCLLASCRPAVIAHLRNPYLALPSSHLTVELACGRS